MTLISQKFIKKRFVVSVTFSRSTVEAILNILFFGKKMGKRKSPRRVETNASNVTSLIQDCKRLHR